MTLLDAAILGILQGLTEFLPVSSSGHLVLAQALLNIKQPGMTFEVLAHVGSLLAVIIYFRETISILFKSLYKKEYFHYRPILRFLFFGTIPIVILGLWLREFLVEAFSSPVIAASMLIVTGMVLFSTRFIPKQDGKLTMKRAVAMGIGQAQALMPGLSRSGTTISIGMMWGLEPSEAAEFSFLLAIPAMIGAVILNYNELLNLNSAFSGQFIVGTLCSFLFSLIAVYSVLQVVRKGKFEYFAYYCFAAGSVGLYLFL